MRTSGSPISGPGKTIDVGRRRSALYRRCGGGVRTGAAVRAVQATRTDLLLETLALRHQLGVLARSSRRFRPTDRPLWLSVAMVLAQMAGTARVNPASHRRSLASRRTTSMLAPPLAAPWTTTNRSNMSRSDSAHGRGELSVWCSADSRRTTQAGNHRFGTHRLAVSARPSDHTVTGLAYVPHESPRPIHVHLAGDVIARVKR